MVQIPQYEQQVGIDAPGRSIPDVNTQVDNSIGQAIGNLAGALGDMYQAKVRRDQAKADFNAKVGYDTYTENVGQALQEAARNAPADGSGLHDQLLTKRSELASTFLSSITDPTLREHYRTVLDTSDAAHWSNQAANEEWKLSNKYSTDQVQGMWDKRQQAVVADPASVKAYVDEMVAAVDQAPDLTPAEREEMKQKIREQGPKIAADSLANTDPEALYFASGRGSHDQRMEFLTRRVIQAESGGDPNIVSDKGAVGLMQVMPDTAVEIAKKVGDQAFLKMSPEQRIEYLKNPNVSKAYGQTYLGMMINRYNGDVEAALVAYNAGPGNADKWLEAGRDYKALPKPGETQPYVQKVFNGMGVAKLAAGPAETGPTAHQDVSFWSSRYQGKRAIHTEMNPEFGSRLQAAINAAEAATGTKAVITSLSRTNAEQREAWRNYQISGGLAARPAGMIDPRTGKPAPGSRHERGMAADIARGPVLDWLHQHAGEYGLKFLQGAAFAKDPVHIQMKLDGKGNQTPVRLADASGTGGLSMNDAGPQTADGVPGGGEARSGFVSSAFSDLPATDLLRIQGTSMASFAAAQQTQLAQDTADSILHSAGATEDVPGDRKAANTALEAIKDADLRKDVAPLIESHFNRWEKVQKDQADAKLKDTWAAVDQAMAANDSATAFGIVQKAGLSPEDTDKLMTRISKGAVQYDDPKVVQTLDAFHFSNPEAFASANIRKSYGGQLTNDTINKYEDMQTKQREASAKLAQTAIDDKTKAQNAAIATMNSVNSTANGRIEESLKAIGIPMGKDAQPTDIQHANFLRATAARELELLTAKLGRPPMLSEINDTVDTVLKTYPRFKPVESSWLRWRKGDADVDMGEVLKAFDDAKQDPQAFVNVLRTQGKPVNAATLQQALEDYQAGLTK